jgi:hypothetical protein
VDPGNFRVRRGRRVKEGLEEAEERGELLQKERGKRRRRLQMSSEEGAAIILR